MYIYLFQHFKIPRRGNTVFVYNLKVRVEKMLIFPITSKVVRALICSLLRVFNCKEIKIPLCHSDCQIAGGGGGEMLTLQPWLWWLVVVSGWHVVTGRLGPS